MSFLSYGPATHPRLRDDTVENGEVKAELVRSMTELGKSLWNDLFWEDNRYGKKRVRAFLEDEISVFCDKCEELGLVVAERRVLRTAPSECLLAAVKVGASRCAFTGEWKVVYGNVGIAKSLRVDVNEWDITRLWPRFFGGEIQVVRI